MTPSLIRSQRSRGPAISVGIEVAEEPQLKVALTSLMTSEEGGEMQLGSPSVMMCNPLLLDVRITVSIRDTTYKID